MVAVLLKFTLSTGEAKVALYSDLPKNRPGNVLSFLFFIVYRDRILPFEYNPDRQVVAVAGRVCVPVRRCAAIPPLDPDMIMWYSARNAVGASEMQFSICPCSGLRNFPQVMAHHNKIVQQPAVPVNVRIRIRAVRFR